jgi:hypothetical protein
MAIYPREFLKTFVRAGARSKCFVLMPFARSFDAVYQTVSEACASPDLLLSCSRVDDFYNPGHIMEDILMGIAGADFLGLACKGTVCYPNFSINLEELR